MSNETKSDKKFNLTLARAYPIKNGYWSVDIGAAELDAILQIEAGGRLVIKTVPEESRKNENSPHAYFQYMTPAEVAEFKKKVADKKTTNNKKAVGSAPSVSSISDF